MNTPLPLDAQQREHLSVMMDGQAESAPAWDDMDGAQVRECWHLYHLVGDVMRAPELAQCTGDAAFLARLRERMNEDARPATAPELSTVPTAAQDAANDGVFHWKTLVGLAAIAAVAFVSWDAAAPQATPGAQMAKTSQPQVNTPVLAAVSPASGQGAAFALEDSAHGVMLRDPYLDELLAAHRQAAGASGLAAAGFLRNATLAGGER